MPKFKISFLNLFFLRLKSKLIFYDMTSSNYYITEYFANLCCVKSKVSKCVSEAQVTVWVGWCIENMSPIHRIQTWRIIAFRLRIDWTSHKCKSKL